MKTRKYQLPSFTPRLTAFLLFLSMLLSTVAVFSSSVYAVATEGEPITEQQPLPEETLSLPDQTVTTDETELENFAENTASVASAVVSSPVIQNAGNTTILHDRTVDMTVGEEQDLRVRTTLTSAQNVAFSVDNPQIVSIVGTSELQYGDAYATIRANKEGTVVVTAKVKNGDTILETVTIELYVVMDDGIYTIKSCATHLPSTWGDYYLRVDPVKSNGKHAIYVSTDIYGDITNNIYRYWKIAYVGNGKYTVRSLMNGGISLSYKNSMLRAFDTFSPTQWSIHYRNNGYEIVDPNSGKGMVFSTGTVDSGYYTDSDYYGYYFAIPSMFELQNMAFERWQIEQVDISGTLLRNNDTNRFTTWLALTTQQNFTLADLGYTLIAYDSENESPAVSWISGDIATATVASDGDVTIESVGEITITASIAGADQSASIYLTVPTLGIENDTDYYIMNYTTGRYLSLASATDANSTNVVTATRSSDTVSQWTVGLQSSGYQLTNVFSNSNRVLHISSNNAVLYQDNNTSYQKFRIERIESGTYKGLYYIRYGEKYLVQNSSNNVVVSTNPVAVAVWSFMAVDKGNADMYDFLFMDKDIDGKDAEFDTTVNKEDFISQFYGYGYTVSEYQNETPTHAFGRLQNADIFVFNGHGEAGVIAFYKEQEDQSRNLNQGEPIGVISVNNSVALHYSVGDDWQYILDLPDNVFASARCVLLLGCNTGDSITLYGNTYNLVDAVYEKGAHFVLGTTETMDIDSDNKFLDSFMNKLNEGGTIEEAYNHAKKQGPFKIVNENDIPETITDFPLYFVGNGKQYLN